MLLVGFMSDALLGPSQRPVEDLDLVRHARLRSKVVRLYFELFLHSSLNSFQACRGARHREVVAVHRQPQLPASEVKVARTGQPSPEAALLQKRRVSLRSDSAQHLWFRTSSKRIVRPRPHQLARKSSLDGNA